MHGALIDCRLLAKVYIRLAALESERDSRIADLMPFPRGCALPEGINALAKGYLALEQAMKPLHDELKRIEDAIKKACRDRPYSDRDVAVTFTPQTRTDWEAIRRKYLNAVDLSSYRKTSTRIRIKGV